MRELTAELRSAVLAFVLAGSASTGLIAWAGLNVAWWLFLLLLNTAAGLFSVFLGWEWRRAAPLAGASLALALGLLGAAAGQVFVLPVQLLSDPFGVRDTSVISVLLVDRLGLGGAGIYYAAVCLVAVLACSFVQRARKLVRPGQEQTPDAPQSDSDLFLATATCFALNALFVQSWIDPAVIQFEAVDSAGKALAVLVAAGLGVAAAYRPALAGPTVLAALAEPSTKNAPNGPDRVRQALTAVLYFAVAGLALVVVGLIWGKEWPALRPWLALVWWVCAPLVVLVALLAVSRWALERLRKRLVTVESPHTDTPEGISDPRAPIPPSPQRLEIVCPPSAKPNKKKRIDWLTVLVTAAVALGGLGAILFGFGMSALWEFLFPLPY